MSFEEEFDSIIRRKAEEEKYPFDESNWDKTNSLLDAERKVTRALKFKKFYLPAVLVVALGSAGFIAFEYFNNTNTSNEVVSVTKSTLPAEKSSAIETSAAQTHNEVKEIKTNSNENSNATTNLNTVSSASPNNLKTSPEPARVSETSEIPKSNSSVNTFSKQKQVASTDNSKAPLEQSKFEAKDTKNKTDVKESDVVANEKLPEHASDQISGSDNSSGVSEVQNTSSSSKEPKDLVSVNTNQNSSLTKNDVPTQNKETETFVENQTEAGSSEESKLDTEHLSAVYSSLPFEMTELDIMSTPFIYLERYDDDYYKNTGTPKKHYLNIEIGANYLLGWNAQKGMDGQGMNGFAGFNYGRYLSNKISISLGLQVYNIANINQPFYLVSSKEYGFGSTNIYTRVTSNQLYYVAVPLKFNYAINSSNVIGFGVNTAYLVGADNTVSKYYLLDNEEKSIGSSTTHNKGVYTGTNMVNMMLSAHYKTQFGKRIGLNMEFNYGLTDIFKNTNAIKTSEKPMGIRLGLSYTLFDK